MASSGRDFKGISEKAAWDLHREFQQDMRLLRDEEFKLADLYMKVTTFAGSAVVLLLIRLPYTHWLGLLALAALVFFIGLLMLFSDRIKKNHGTYQELGSWIKAIRCHHASQAYPDKDGEGFGKGRGYRRQLNSLYWCASLVTIMVGGCLLMSAIGVLQSNATGP